MPYGVGTTGPQGPQGAQGAQGIQGATGVTPVLTGNGSTVGIKHAAVDTIETTTSTSYTNLTTVGPTVITTTGDSALVIIKASSWQDSSGPILERISFTVTNSSGVTTHAADDSRSASGSQDAAAARVNLKNVIKVTGLTPGSNTFTMKYKTSASRAGFSHRTITVIPI